MGNALDKAMQHPQTAIGKGKVGEPEHEPGYKGVTIRVAIFFDGTKNNRANTLKRIRDPSILVGKGKDDESSYANFLSNVAIMELLNKHKNLADRQVSVYVEGIGTNNFEEGATVRYNNGKEVKDKNGKSIKVTDNENGNDSTIGYALGSGTTGIVAKVNKGIKELKQKIPEAYKPSSKGKEYISKLIIDVVGFSRGAAAARHFVSRRNALRTGWLNQGAPEIEINFVGLYDSVSSYESLKGVGGEATMLLSGLVPLLGGNPAVGEFSTDRIFGDDVLQLGLDMGDVPKKVVHLTAADEYRENFSLTNINTSLKAGVGVEARLPGAHSDIGGGYTEGTRLTKRREMNKEVRRIHDTAEKQQLISDGWYLPNQFEPWKQYHTPAIPSIPVLLPRPGGLPPVVVGHTPAVKSYPISVWENGVRYLTHEYQFVSLFIMLGFASREGKHLAMSFETLTGNRAGYQVPSDLVSLRDYFDGKVRALDGKGGGREEGELSIPTIKCRSEKETNELRNQYLHRSARLPSEGKVGMAGREDAGRKGRHRRTIADDMLFEKPQDTARRKTKEKAAQAQRSVINKLNQLQQQSNRALELVKEGAKKGLEQLGKYPPPRGPYF